MFLVSITSLKCIVLDSLCLIGWFIWASATSRLLNNVIKKTMDSNTRSCCVIFVPVVGFFLEKEVDITYDAQVITTEYISTGIGKA
jgi:hypothetical protein